MLGKPTAHMIGNESSIAATAGLLRPSRRTFLASSLAVCGLGAMGAQGGKASGPITAPRTKFLTSGFSSVLDRFEVADETTFAVCLPLEDEAEAVRCGFVNLSPRPYTIAAARVSASANYGDFVDPTGDATGNASWADLSFASAGLATPGNIVSKSSALSFQVPPSDHCSSDKCPDVAPRIWWSDFVRIAKPATDGGSLSFLMVRVRIPGQQSVTGLTRDAGWTNKPIGSGRNVGFSSIPGDFVSNPAAIPQAAHTDFSPVVCLEYVSRNSGISVVCGGDSHFADPLGFAVQACWELSSAERPMSCWNLAMPAVSSDVFWPLLDRNVEDTSPSVVLLQGWTANDPQIGSADTTARYLQRIGSTASKTLRYGGLPIFVTPFPRGKETLRGANYEQWKSARDTLLRLRDGGTAVFDATSVLGQRDGDGFSGEYLPGYSGDGIHANAVGHRALALELKKFLMPFL